ncbi:MAG: MerR family transcriptional regulator [Bacteroidetes bacterium]|nr:MerR family transcriptional regulator [Bacteroidota bacterium]
MELYSISQLEKLSGVRSHTIRAWEKRYNAVQPQRSEGNTRYYDDNQLRRLLNIVALLEAGHKVSTVGRMSDTELRPLLARVSEDTTWSEGYEYFISGMINAAIAYDEMALDRLFRTCLLRMGLKTTYIHVVYPLLSRVGLMWGMDCIRVGQEHFLSNYFRQKLLTAIDAVPPAKPTAEKWVLFLPQGEFHELGLLCAYYTIKLAGGNVYYLGANLPQPALESAVASISPGRLLFFVVHNDAPGAIRRYLDELGAAYPQCSICMASHPKMIDAGKLPKNIQLLYSLAELEALLGKDTDDSRRSNEAAV